MLIVYGMGAIGGAVAGSLALSGVAVAGIARGAHLETIRSRGLTLRAPFGDHTVALLDRVVGHPRERAWNGSDVVVLATKGQDARAALEALAEVAPRSTAIVCAQNGVANERVAAEYFDRVYGAMVYTPATHLEPGTIATWSEEGRGLIDVGLAGGGIDQVAEEVSASLRVAGFDSRPDGDVMGLKRAKLLYNLGNVVQALCGPQVPRSELAPVLEAAASEAEACYRAAGWDPAALRRRFLERVAQTTAKLGEIDGEGRQGGSSWQSLQRRVGRIEAGYLNGEIVRMGREHGVPTPVNARLVELGDEAARRKVAPGSMTVSALVAALGGS